MKEEGRAGEGRAAAEACEAEARADELAAAAAEEAAAAADEPAACAELRFLRTGTGGIPSGDGLRERECNDELVVPPTCFRG